MPSKNKKLTLSEVKELLCRADLGIDPVQIEEFFQSVTDLRSQIITLRGENESLQSLVNIDALTGVFNHRYFQQSLGREMSKARRHKRPLSLIVCDIDYFKAFNDSFGHQIGDAVLRHFASTLSGNIRQYDILARYGGEEFALILSETNLDQARSIAKKLRRLVFGTPYKEEGQAYNITASFGVACFLPVEGQECSKEKLIYNADQAMLQAKQCGRNRVEVHAEKSVPKSTLEVDIKPQKASVQASDKPSILLVDEEPENLDILIENLSDEYDFRVAHSGREIFKQLEKAIPDLILLDAIMPDISGYEVCRVLKNDPRYDRIPIILVTSLAGKGDEVKAFELGAVDYVTKPVFLPILKVRIENCLQMQRHQHHLEEIVAQRTAELVEVQDATIECMVAVTEYRDPDTAQHTHRCRIFMNALAIALHDNPKYRRILTPEMIESLSKAAPLHDIGKVAIPDSILLKKGKLTVEEYETMKQHTTMGHRAITAAEAKTGSSLLFLKTIKEIVLGHHEHWDGYGYPQGISREEIPLSARMMAVVDVYDALTSKRCYKSSYSHAEAIKFIKEFSGSQFDPQVVEAFVRIEEQIKQIAEANKDPEQ